MAASMLSGFLSEKAAFKEFLSNEDLLDTTTAINNLKARRLSSSVSDKGKLDPLDLALKEVLCQAISEDAPIPQFLPLLDFTITAATQDLCSTSTIFNMLSDLNDCSTITQCEELFSFVEGKVQQWKSDRFFAIGKNHLLRMCNDVLKKLSKSQNTVFCGRIQLFLARLFPLTEKSGLNLHSEFNLDNLTIFSQVESADVVPLPPTDKDKTEEKMDTDAIEALANESPVDYYFYTRFWSLQDFFREPTQCYKKPGWAKFTTYSDAILSAFRSAKLDDSKMQKQRTQLDKLRRKGNQEFFAKYLTSEKLLNLQMNDGNFRRYVLVQYLILFQYFTEENKFRSAAATLSDNQQEWVKKTSALVYELITQTPPDGQAFCSIVKHLLEREKSWNAWKNEGCPSFVKNPNPNEKRSRIVVRKRSMVDDLNITEKKQFNLGNTELSRLWNLHQDNDAIIRSETRQFLPAVDSHFEDAIMQSDPANQIENTYKDVYKAGWQWRALRLLSKKTKYLFEQTQQPARKVPEFLEDIMKKLSKEITSSQDTLTTEQDEDIQQRAEEVEELDEEPEEPESITSTSDMGSETKVSAAKDDVVIPEPAPPVSDIVSDDRLNQLSSLLLDKWPLLADKLAGLDKDDLAYFESKDSPAEQAKNMLTVWKEIASKKATSTILKAALEEAGLFDIGAKIFTL